jgi:hypothetical protein
MFIFRYQRERPIHMRKVNLSLRPIASGHKRLSSFETLNLLDVYFVGDNMKLLFPLSSLLPDSQVNWLIQPNAPNWKFGQ